MTKQHPIASDYEAPAHIAALAAARCVPRDRGFAPEYLVRVAEVASQAAIHEGHLHLTVRLPTLASDVAGVWCLVTTLARTPAYGDRPIPALSIAITKPYEGYSVEDAHVLAGEAVGVLMLEAGRDVAEATRQAQKCAPKGDKELHSPDLI